MKAYELIPHPRTIFGSGSCVRAGEVLKDYSVTKCLIITGPSMTRRGYVGKVGASLDAAGIAWDVFDKTAPDPTDICVLEAAEAIRVGGYDGVIGLGGGSPMDVAKAACMVAGFEEPVDRLFNYRRGSGPKARTDWKRKYALLTMPTTSGTSAESSATGVITDSISHQKFSFGSNATVPDAAIVDPEFTLGMPAKPTALTALDAICHGMEIMVGNAQSDFTSLVVLDCIKRLWKWLPVAVEEPNNLEAREQLSWAAHNVMSNGGMTNGHAIAHSIGATYNMVHGHACIITLPTVIRHHAETHAASIAAMADVMGLPVSDCPAETAETVASAVKAMYKEMGLESLQEYFAANGITDTREEFAEKLTPMTLTDFKAETFQPPIHLNPEDCKAIIAKVYDDK